MRNVLIFTNVLFLGAALYFGYKHFYNKRPDTNLVPACSTCGTDMGTAFGGLNAKVARDLSGNYQTRQLANINSAGYVPNDARSVWFPLDTIKRFIQEIEKGNCRNGCTDRSYGIRLYYAAYPDIAAMITTSQLSGLPQGYEKHHTIFMVPTYTDANSGGPMDFDPWHMKGCTAIPFRQLMSPKLASEKSLILLARDYPVAQRTPLSSSSSTSNTVQNHGGLCPPVCTPPVGIDF